jgi:hypothetical protein
VKAGIIKPAHPLRRHELDAVRNRIEHSGAEHRHDQKPSAAWSSKRSQHRDTALMLLKSAAGRGEGEQAGDAPVRPWKLSWAHAVGMVSATVTRRVKVFSGTGVRHVAVTLPRLRCLDGEDAEIKTEDLRVDHDTVHRWRKRLARQDGRT